MRAAEVDQQVEDQRLPRRIRTDPEAMYVTHDPPGSPALPHEWHRNTGTILVYDSVPADPDFPIADDNVIHPCCCTPECGGEVKFFVALKILADASSVSKHLTFHGGNVLLQTSKPLVKVKQTFKTDVVLLNKLSLRNAG